MAAAALSLRRSVILPSTPAAAPAGSSSSSSKPVVAGHAPRRAVQVGRRRQWWGISTLPPSRTRVGPGSRIAAPSAGSRADDSSKPYDMSVENALKLLGVAEGASFEDILRAKNAIVASCKDDQEAIAKDIVFPFPETSGPNPKRANFGKERNWHGLEKRNADLRQGSCFDVESSELICCLVTVLGYLLKINCASI